MTNWIDLSKGKRGKFIAQMMRYEKQLASLSPLLGPVANLSGQFDTDFRLKFFNFGEDRPEVSLIAYKNTKAIFFSLVNLPKRFILMSNVINILDILTEEKMKELLEGCDYRPLIEQRKFKLQIFDYIYEASNKGFIIIINFCDKQITVKTGNIFNRKDLHMGRGDNPSNMLVGEIQELRAGTLESLDNGQRTLMAFKPKLDDPNQLPSERSLGWLDHEKMELTELKGYQEDSHFGAMGHQSEYYFNITRKILGSSKLLIVTEFSASIFDFKNGRTIAHKIHSLYERSPYYKPKLTKVDGKYVTGIGPLFSIISVEKQNLGTSDLQGQGEQQGEKITDVKAFYINDYFKNLSWRMDMRQGFSFLKLERGNYLFVSEGNFQELELGQDAEPSEEGSNNLRKNTKLVKKVFSLEIDPKTLNVVKINAKNFEEEFDMTLHTVSRVQTLSNFLLFLSQDKNSTTNPRWLTLADPELNILDEYKSFGSACGQRSSITTIRTTYSVVVCLEKKSNFSKSTQKTRN